MVRFDVTRARSGIDLYLDCQADLFRDFRTRFVVPLRRIEHAPPPLRRLNPVFVIEDRQWMMLTQAAAAVAVREIGPRVTSLLAEESAITNALDLLIYGI